ncbi:hypothetical protein [Prevotella sp.]|uniref:hypothetical protein n=1 Tax=Prevotella sp. TaxID=59823 RepID=UPI0027E2EDEB|nr:hypothetical protein [Prevotella sp.]
MKYSREYIERLLGKFVDGLTTELEEQQLAEYFDTADDIPAEWQVYKEMFRSFKTDDYNFSNAELDAMLTSDVAVEPSAAHILPKHTSHVWRWVSVAACAAVVVAFVAIRPWTAFTDNTSAVDKMVAVEKSKRVDEVKSDVDIVKTQDTGMTEKSGILDNSAKRKTQSKRLTKKRLPTVEPSVVNSVDNIIATVTLPNEQVESYEIRKVGEANIVTKCYDDGTSASFIVSCSDDELSSQFIALN